MGRYEECADSLHGQPARIARGQASGSCLSSNILTRKLKNEEEATIEQNSKQQKGWVVFGNPFCHVSLCRVLTQFDICHLQVRGSYPGKKVLAFKSGRNRRWFLLHTESHRGFLEKTIGSFQHSVVSTRTSPHESATNSARPRDNLVRIWG